MELSQHFTCSSAGVTDVGKTRSINEDAIGLRPEIGLWVVADGVGGHEAGEVASAAVVRALNDVTFPSSIDSFIDTVKKRLQQVNKSLVLSRGVGRTGSTVVVLLAHGDQCACIWAGDSRLYRLRNDVLHAMTRDHTYVQDLIQSGQLAPEEAASHPQANVITRAIGAAELVEFDVGLYDLQDGDRYLLCSDGLYQEVSEQELYSHLQQGSCNLVVDALLQSALQRGARDNVSAVVVDFVECH